MTDIVHVPQAFSLMTNDPDLPAYTAPVRQTNPSTPIERIEHVVSLDDGCFTLKVSSHTSNPNSLPVFMEGEPVTGTIELDLREPDPIKTVFIAFEGLVVYSGFDSKKFLNLTQTVWSRSMGDPRNALPTANAFTEKLSGKYSWPFSFTLPTKVQLSENAASDLGLSGNEKLPPTVADRGWHSDINYQITAKVERSGLFQVNTELTTLVGYYPATRPEAPSPLRTLVYQEHTPIMGPDVDVEGWKVFPAVHLEGRLFKAINTRVSMSLALPIPLAYPRGSAFPCALVMESSNKECINLLSVPQAPVVEMHRKLQTSKGESMSGSALQFADDDRVPFTKANWHPTQVCESNGIYTCTILGELSLPHNLVPSFAFGTFFCKYVVDVYAPQVVGFEPVGDERLFRTEVSVTSLLPHGPHPQAYLPPGYHAVGSSNALKGGLNALESAFL